MTKAKMIFFDVDNTLIDHHKSEAQALIRLCKELHITGIKEDLLISYWRQVSKKLYNLYLLGQLTFQEQRLQRVREFLLRFAALILLLTKL